ncbi:MAG TPA: methyl-accepting chemotaxis protein [Pusillimonas sp.]|uniref:methyl-accepting chemotaxis protein n=1 Tax=Pusillimonas sp. TaxID=3040095 RepID=UPI002CC2C0AB|nr:methyl-accepting chemotaxis protein [Pusillimonas sp.]HUH86823.1 methyl-accepting chemotaxis protein [Pusillimonas sp.]
MNKFNIGTRLAFGFSLLLLLLATLAAIGVWRINGSSNIAANVISDRLPVERVMSEWYQATSLNAVRTIAAGKIDDPYMRHDIEKAMEQTSAEIQRLQDQLAETLDEPGEIALFKKVLERRTEYRDKRNAAFQARIVGDNQTANNFFENELEKLLAAYTGSVQDLLQFERKLIDDQAVELYDANNMGMTLLVALTIVALLIGVFMSFTITRSITLPLRRAVDFAATVSSRDLTATIEVSGRDETSRLLEALKQMNDNLQSVVSDVLSGAGSIASAAEQIAAGNVDLSSRTEEQASSLAETAATMEELTATVRQNADHAKVASGLADSAVQVAVKSGEVVAQVVESMGAINESSKHIADIINVIDTIAFQTNILALNAAVEAARAGEQGRGFAVVASEVRALAQRSASAAREIKGLIDTSVARTAEGNRQVTEAGERMRETVAGIRRVTDIMSEITAASQEQSVGIDQVNQAVSEMDQATQQNAALVEEAAAAAGSLQDQSAKLARLVATFKIDRQGSSYEPAEPVELLGAPHVAQLALSH